jgi:hypothetical protein
MKTQILKMIISSSLIGLAFYSQTTESKAQSFFADKNGNFTNKSHIHWEVVDPTGLNVRSSPQLVSMLKKPRSQWTSVDPNTWSPQWKLPQGYMIQAQLVQSSVLIFDVRGNPWLIIIVGNKGVGVVRASQNYISPPSWSEPIKADSNGNFCSKASTSQHMFWEIVDSDPAGVNQRMQAGFAKTYDHADGDFPTEPIASWPIVGRVQKGTILRAVLGNLGTICHQDANGSTWLLLRRKSSDTWKNYESVAFVRANIKFVRPVAGPILKP